MPLTFADPSQSDDIAAQNLATGTPTDFETNFSAAWHSSALNDRFGGKTDALEDQYSQYIDHAFRTTGQRLPNPIAGELPPGATHPRGPLPQSIAVQEFEDYARKLGASPPNFADMQAQATARRFQLEQTRNDAAQRASGPLASTGSFLGSAAAVATDPPVLASMAFGGPETSTFLGAVAREAAIAAGTEAVVQPQIQSQRIAAGLPGGVTQGAENVAAAAVGAAGLTTVFRGAGAAYGALRNRAADYLASSSSGADAAATDAARYAERFADLQSANPLAETPEAAAEHVDRLSAAQQRLYDPASAVPETRLPDDPASPVRPAQEPSEPIPTREAAGPQIASGDADTAVTATGRQVPVKYAVVEASDLIPSQTAEGGANPQYPAELQPRDRTRAVSQTQIASIAQNLDPRLLDRSPTASDGAPIVASSGVVESGNGRVLAIQRAYSDNLPSARDYRTYLEKQGYSTQGVRQPVLVRVRQGEMAPTERQAFVREANQSGTLGYSATERAMNDAAAMPDSALDLYRGGDVEQAQNREFVKAFMNRLPQSEHAVMIDATGALSQDAIRRIRGALLAKAYGDPGLVSGIVESADTNIKAIGGALTDGAADWAKMRARAARGDMPAALDTTGKLLDAVRVVQHARNESRNVAEFVGQGDMFGGSLDPQTEAWLRLMFRNTKDWTQPVGRERLAESIRYYAQEASKAEGDKNLFGMEPSKPSDILALAKEKQHGGEPAGSGNLAFDYGRGVRPGRNAGAELGPAQTAGAGSRDLARLAGPDAATAAGIAPEAVNAARAAGERLAEQARASASGANAARAARDTSQALDARGLTDDQINLARGPEPQQPASDRSLLSFIVARGGINDADRSLASVGITPRTRPGLMRRSGLSADRMAQLASDAGYFPRAAGPSELTAAIREELGGSKLYARYGSSDSAQARAAYENTVSARNDLRSTFQKLGLDPSSLSNDEMRDAVRSIATTGRDVPAVQNDFTSQAIDSAKAAASELDRQAGLEASVAAAAERDLRSRYADRMDEPVYVQAPDGSVRSVAARDLFDDLTNDEKLVKEFGNCIGGG